MSNRKVWKMRLVKHSDYWRSREPWKRCQVVLTQSDLDEWIPGYTPVNRLHLDDLRVQLSAAQANHALMESMR